MTRVHLGPGTEACRLNNAEALGCPSQLLPEERRARDGMRRMVLGWALVGASRDELPGQSSRQRLSLGPPAARLVPPLPLHRLMFSAHEYRFRLLVSQPFSTSSHEVSHKRPAWTCLEGRRRLRIHVWYL